MSLWNYDPFFHRSPFDRFFGFDDHDDFDLLFDSFNDAFWNRKRAREQLQEQQQQQQQQQQLQKEGTTKSQEGNEKENRVRAPARGTAGREVARSHLNPFNQLQSLTSILNADLVETATGFEIHADVPGVELSDVDISVVDPRTILIVAERKQLKVVEGKDDADQSESNKVHTRERAYGVVQRRIRLPVNADLTGATSSLKNGVLTVSVPKKPLEENKGGVRKIPINVIDN